jgi:ATP-binding cassette subfamily A (ABC1) protein 2
MYCRLRGIPEAEIPNLVQWSVEKMQLQRWADRVASVYSGGNKRKLSIAIALLGKSSMVALDGNSTCYVL